MRSVRVPAHAYRPTARPPDRLPAGPPYRGSPERTHLFGVPSSAPP